MNPTLDLLVATARASAARCGTTRVIAIDGPAGAGKTTLAGRLAAALGGAQVLHADDMYEGWSGLATLSEVLVGEVLEPLARFGRASFRRWDWVAGARAETIEVPAAPFLVIEGVGTAQRAARLFVSLVIYVDAPWAVRLERGIARDGETMRAEWERWQAAEGPFLVREGTRAAADVEIDGTAPVE